MNEHIKELVRRCDGYYVDDDGKEATVPVLVGQNVEKFAELIIRECANICFSDYADKQPLHSDGFDLATRIIEHFGVEE